MFNKDFYPTPPEVIEQLMAGTSVKGQVVYDPSAGSGNMLKWAIENGASKTLATEIEPELRRVCSQYADQGIGEDFLKVEEKDIVHVDLILMNPPYSQDEAHFLHAWNIAPPGCTIKAIMPTASLDQYGTSKKRQVLSVINAHGFHAPLGEAFSQAERKTNVDVSAVTVVKPGEEGEDYSDYFSLEEDFDEGGDGIRHYNLVRDIVNRYVGCMRHFDRIHAIQKEMNALCEGYFYNPLTIEVRRNSYSLQRSDFESEMKKRGWETLIRKLNMDQYNTSDLEKQIASLAQKQSHIPFTMKNCYALIEMIIGTQKSRMDKAIVGIFDEIVDHNPKNIWENKSWKTNQKYVLGGQKFILSGVFEFSYSGRMCARSSFSSNYRTKAALIDDLNKALHWIMGRFYETNFNKYEASKNPDYEFEPIRIDDVCSKLNPHTNEWFPIGPFLEIKGFKNGNGHVRFSDEVAWAKFNQKVAEIKGFPLPESIKKKARQNKKEQEPEKSYRMLA